MVNLAGVAPLSPLTAILIACAVVAWAITRGWRRRARWPFYRAVALLLTWACVTALARGVLQHWVLNPARAAIGPGAPYEGTARLAYFGELALRTTWPFAILAAAFAVFLRRRAWWALPAWWLAAGWLCAAYPDLGRKPQAWAEAGIAAICLVASGWAFRRGKDVDPVPSHEAMVLIMAAQLAVIVGIQSSGEPHLFWSIARLVHGGMYAWLLWYQVRKFREAA
ncbi:hypothetical protein WMF30_10470 [Sorangium sp. So ce134]